ncbi:MAG: hypothetical protein U5K74_07825 [Gemmatimonadaceae bacterium]|nr:hypothetical protein [Gemmatimonadaceae bacterium]
MIKQAMTMVVWAAVAAGPALVGAQTTTPPATEEHLTCDCPIGDSKGDLRNLKAFAPLGLLGVMAAAGGVPGVFAARTDDVGTNPNLIVANNPAGATPPAGAADPSLAVNEGARNASPDAPATGVSPSLNRSNVPIPVSPDSMRAGLRAPNTGTPLPSVFLLGTGLVAIGCVTVLRTRS